MTKAAKTKSVPPAVVELRCERLGETRSFDPGHAARLLARQAERGKQAGSR